jgi:hypothetical protein
MARWLAPELELLKPLALIALGAKAKAALDSNRDSIGHVDVFTVPHPSFSNRGSIYQLLPKAEDRLGQVMSELPMNIGDFIAKRRTLSRQTVRARDSLTLSTGDRKFLVAYRTAFTDIRLRMGLRALT